MATLIGKLKYKVPIYSYSCFSLVFSGVCGRWYMNGMEDFVLKTGERIFSMETSGFEGYLN